MRSRYCAYALGLTSYIMDTTHPDHADFSIDRARWKGEIEVFSKHTRFDKLKILDFKDGDQTATVMFTAYLRQADNETSFTENSTFEKIDGKWFYKSGEVGQT
ncbi:hypothetical protein BH10CYA1_BH10CYA1_46840 [soil metagenome]